MGWGRRPLLKKGPDTSKNFLLKAFADASRAGGHASCFLEKSPPGSAKELKLNHEID